jgi:hypothetical protein
VACSKRSLRKGTFAQNCGEPDTLVEGLTLEEECLDVHVPLTHCFTRLKRKVRAPSCSRALKRKRNSVHIGTITHGLAISRQHVAVLAARFFGCQDSPLHCTN